MPLFGFRKDKKHEQAHIQATAELAKNPASSGKVKSGGRKSGSMKPEKVSSQVVTKDAGAAVGSAIAAPKGAFGSSADAVIRPHITEKSGILAQSGVYSFRVDPAANKTAVAKAIRALYKVTPVRVAIVNLPAKTIVVKGRYGTVPGFKKALVTVKKGDKIDFV
jgi:large subunit ribosomal protein L23